MGTSTVLHEWMLEYQAENGRPPLMREMAEQFESLGYRSSVRYALLNLVDGELVREIKQPGSSRRYEAVCERG
jgi:hypothetical protein